MKYGKILLLIISLTFFSSISVNALELCEMADEYEKWLNLTEEERKNTIEPPYCKELYKNANASSQLLEIESYIDIKENIYSNTSASATQKRYNSYDYNQITPARDQKKTNSCWAFASLSTVETSAIMDGLPATALSAKHVEYMVTRNAFDDSYNNYGFDRELDAGGNPYFAASYFFRHDGPILESSMPYTETHSTMKTSDLPKDEAYFDVGSYRTEYYDSSNSCNTNQIETIKNYVIEHGSVAVSIFYKDSYLNKDLYYNYSGSNNSNHAVTIVGWDDTISASNFKNASTDGAWIVKNSWGTKWGNNGTFYVSYSDTRVCGSITVFYDIRKNTFDNTYFASDTLANVSFPLNSGYLYSKARFEKKGKEDEYLDKVSVEVNAGNRYNIYVTTNADSEKGWKEVGSGYATVNSIVTARFEPIKITGTYHVIVKYTGGSFPTMCKTLFKDIHDEINISTGINYYTLNSRDSWLDMSTITQTNLVKGCEPVIYAYTTNGFSEEPTFKIDSLTGSSSKVYRYTDEYFNLNISSSNINSYQKFKFKVTNTSGTDVTSYFEISNTVANGVVKIKPRNDAIPGKYKIIVTYEDKSLEKEFTFYELITSTNYTIDEDYIIVSLNKDKSLDKNSFVSNIKFNTSNYRLLSSSSTDVTSTASLIGTGMQLEVEGKSFTIVVKGDTSGDGKILSNDALLIKRHLVYLSRLNDAQILAADVSKDNNVLSNDSLLISRFLIGARDSL